MLKQCLQEFVEKESSVPLVTHTRVWQSNREMASVGTKKNKKNIYYNTIRARSMKASTYDVHLWLVRSTLSSLHYYYYYLCWMKRLRDGTRTTFTESALNSPPLDTQHTTHTVRGTPNSNRYTIALEAAKCFCHEEQYISLMERIEIYLIFYLFTIFSLSPTRANGVCVCRIL